MTTRMDADPDEDPERAAGADTPAAATAESSGDGTDDGDGGDSVDSGDEFDHLDSLSDGVGCTEIWEHLSETRDEE